MVLLICGLPGSGKSTLSASLVGKGWSQVSQDDLGTQDEMTKALEKHLKHGRSVIIDRCCVTPSERKTWVRRAHAACAKGHSVRVEAVFLDVPAELCKHRVRTRTNHPTLGPDSADVVDEFCRGLKAPEKWEGPYDACCVVACDADVKTVKARYADPKAVNAKEMPAGKGAWELPAAVAGAGPSSGKGAAACNVYVVRHGERTDRVTGEHVENHHDCQITTAGKAQARKAGEFISNHLHSTGGLGSKVDVVYTSPFFRCVQTAAEVAGQVGVPTLRVEPGLGELFAKRLFESQPALTRPSTVLRNIEPLGIGLDQSVAPVAATLPVWPEPGKAASKRVRDTVLALMQRHAGQTIVLAVHAHGLVEASSSVPKRAAANVQSMPGYCAVTHVDSAGFADVVTDLGYRGGTTGSYVSAFLGQPLQPPPPPAGAFSNAWEWKSSPKSAAAAAAPAASPSPPAATVAAAPAAAPPAAAAVPVDGVVDAEAQEEDAADIERRVDAMLAQPIESVLEAYPKFRSFFELGTGGQQRKFMGLWREGGAKARDKVRSCLQHGLCDSSSADRVHVLTVDAGELGDSACDAVLSAVAGADDLGVVCLQNATADLYAALLKKGPGRFDTFACSMESTRPTAAHFNITFCHRDLSPQFQVATVRGAPEAVFSTLFCATETIVLCNTVLPTVAVAKQVTEMMAGCRKAQAAEDTSMVVATNVSEGASVAALGVGSDYAQIAPKVFAYSGNMTLESTQIDGASVRACLGLKVTDRETKAAAIMPKFPRTMHAYAVGEGAISGDDLLLSAADAKLFFHSGAAITVEEKIDGSNLGLWFDQHANVTCQNRGKVVNSSSGTQWKSLDAWLDQHKDELFASLGERYILYGEWLAARHSVRYTRLPSYFVAFDLYDRRAKAFLSVRRRDEILSATSLSVIRPLASGVFPDKKSVTDLLTSAGSYSDEAIEGVYLRLDTPDAMWLSRRAKIVNAAFLDAIEEGHWQKRTMEKNALAL